ncbi:TatD family hydrolase [Paenibacillus sp. y28]|uniref:TatD family hydrolase n=1 Tax=Paenibacillus sp. y28 TaxID=3129110 RepID=UPI003016F539
MMTTFIDIGVNLMHRSFAEDRDQVISRAEAAGVSPLIITGTSLRSSEEAARYAKARPGKLYSTAGVHPHDAKHFHAGTARRLEELAGLPEVVAIGECGLDYNRDFSPRSAQIACFTAQVELACRTGLPLFLHDREAHHDFMKVLREHKAQLPAAVVHCFTGSASELEAYLAAGFYIGITGWICDERRGKPLQQLVRRIPLDRLLVETDAPFLTPRDLPVKPDNSRNEPVYLPHVVQRLARCLGVPAEQVAASSTANAHNLFGIGPERQKA